MSGSSALPPEQPDSGRPRDASPAPAPAPAPPKSTFTAPPSAPSSPTGMIGPFRILEKIGEGGMGEVFLADQTSPVRRRVALKLIKLGMDTKEVVARFESERQALALLNHPNIAHVFDAGSTPDGRPYFAMEFVKGISIRAYCDTERLTMAERLRLFIQTCDGVQHAHQKGIIHRDLKPSNILVTMLDGKPVPKIIDFGIAKATSQRLTESTLHTAVGHLVGTPAYMSPEQADYTLLDIDTRTDVYSLGAVLYEILTGELPLGQGAPRSQGFEEIIRTIREVEPLRPSARLTVGATAAEIAKSFRADVPSLARDLRGDLDWIVLKALEKDRTRRYDSVSELAADIERHLSHEPVLASPPSTPYRVRKFVRRHRVGVAAGAAVGLALIAGIVGTSLGLVRAREEAETATQVTDIMVDLFHVSNPSDPRGDTITKRDVLDNCARSIQQSLKEKPVVRSRLMDAIGNVYTNLGLFATAEPILLEALAMREKTMGPKSTEVATSLMSLAGVFAATNRHAESIALVRRSLAIRQSRLEPDDIDIGRSEYGLGSQLVYVREPAEAKEHLMRALEIFRRHPGKGDQGASWCQNDLGILSLSSGGPGEALPYFQEALRLKEKALGPWDPDVAMGLNNIGYLLIKMGRYVEARSLLERAGRIYRRSLGPEHPLYGNYLQSLGELLRLVGETSAARDTLERALAIREPLNLSSDPDVILAHQSLATLYANLGLDAKAEVHFRREIDGLEKSDNKPDLAECLEKYADVLDHGGRGPEASRLRARAKDLRASLPAAKPLPPR